MRRWSFRLRYGLLALSSGAVLTLSGCGLTDQQLAGIWQSVIIAGLNTLLGSALQGAAGAA